jgi:hypothetical protein
MSTLQAVPVWPTTKRGSGGARTTSLRPHAPWCGGAPRAAHPSGFGDGRAMTLTGCRIGFDDGGTEHARDTSSICVRAWHSRAVQHGEAAKFPTSSVSSSVAGAALGVFLAVGSAVATPAAFAEPVVGLVDGATPTPSLFHNTARRGAEGDDTHAYAGHLRGCAPRTSCVSTSAGNAPSQYMPPWDVRATVPQTLVPQPKLPHKRLPH